MAQTVFEVNEQTSARYTATLLDEVDAPVVLADVETLQLWLRDVKTGSYINYREAQSVLNVNGVTFAATSGLLTWQLEPADNAIVGSGTSEYHEAVFEATWDSGNKGVTHSFLIKVKNMHPIT